MAVNVVRAIVQSYLDFMDRMHKGTAGDISRMLTHEREELSDKLASKQEELLECRRHFADMGFRSDGKTLHPMVQRAVYFNDAPDCRSERAGRARSPAGDHSHGNRQRRGPGAVSHCRGRHGRAGNAVELPRSQRPRRQHAGRHGAELDCRPCRSADGACRTSARSIPT